MERVLLSGRGWRGGCAPPVLVVDFEGQSSQGPRVVFGHEGHEASKWRGEEGTTLKRVLLLAGAAHVMKEEIRGRASARASEHLKPNVQHGKWRYCLFWGVGSEPNWSRLTGAESVLFEWTADDKCRVLD